MDNTADSLAPIGDLSTLGSKPMSLISDSIGETSSQGSSWGILTILGISFLIILVLAVIGLNVFSYLAVGTQNTANFISNISNVIKQYTSSLSIPAGLGNIVGVSAIGTKEIIDTASKDVNFVSSKIDQAAENLLDPIIQKTTQLKGVPVSPPAPTNNTENNALNRALNRQQALEGGSSGPTGSNYEADDAVSSIQKNSGKAGWCYIGEENGTRTCAKVGVKDTCMSGDIFPSNEICINPNLRP